MRAKVGKRRRPWEGTVIWYFGPIYGSQRKKKILKSAHE
jgi:hypothetical protein